MIGATVYHYDLSGTLITASDSFGVLQKEALTSTTNWSLCKAMDSKI